MSADGTTSARAPGRLTIVGEHTDYNQGRSLTIATDGHAIEAHYRPGSPVDFELTSSAFSGVATVRGTLSPRAEAIRSIDPPWARLAGAVIALLQPPVGGSVHFTSSLATESGLSSSAAFVVAMGLALRPDLGVAQLAQISQEAESLVGIDVGTLDPIAIAGAAPDHALWIDFAHDQWRPVGVSAEVEFAVIDTGQPRSLIDSPYGQRRLECAAAEALIGPLGLASIDDLAQLPDGVLRQRAHHVITECARVDQSVECLRAGDVVSLGRIMGESHRSLRDDYQSSTPLIDELVEQLDSDSAVLGSRIVGGGFGGSVVALVRRGQFDLARWPGAFVTRPGDGARVLNAVG